jgi:transcriptional regulator with XRE-family HTH domain
MQPCGQKNFVSICEDEAERLAGTRTSPLLAGMSYFRVALTRAAERRQINQAELARLAGLSRSYVSRLVTGDNADLSDANLAAILKVFSADQRTQAELVAARCMDARVGPGSELVRIEVRGEKSEVREPDLPDVRLGAETERAFAWLRSQCPVNADLEKHLVGYAKLTGMK